MAIAVDTNVLIRALTGDDPAQTPIAQAVMSSDVLVPVSVLLEAEWVLRSRYRWSRARISAGLLTLLRLPSVRLQGAARMRWALARHAEGADLADMVHVAMSHRCEAFATFDGALARQAGSDSPARIRALA